jgi:hypothetical protein
MELETHDQELAKHLLALVEQATSQGPGAHQV